MIDWVGGIESRNYGIGRATALPNLTELIRSIMPIAVLAGFLCGYLWSYSQVVHLGYEDQQVQTLTEGLRRDQKDLILEEETLKNPQRIDGIARNELSMGPLHANQILAPQGLDMELAGTTVLALADPSSTTTQQERKPSADN